MHVLSRSTLVHTVREPGFGLLQHDLVPEFLLNMFSYSSRLHTGTWSTPKSATHHYVCVSGFYLVAVLFACEITPASSKIVFALVHARECHLQ